MRRFLQQLGWVEKTFAAVLLAWLMVYVLLPGSLLRPLLQLAVLVLGAAVALIVTKRVLQKASWRLRNRLLIAYLFIAFLPIVLLVLLAEYGAVTLAGQVADYLVSAEWERRVDSVRGVANAIVRASPENRAEFVKRMGAFWKDRYPGLQLVGSGSAGVRFPESAAIEAPPDGWPETSGVVVKDGLLYIWAHAKQQNAEATVLAPLTRSFLARLVPNLGQITLVSFAPAGGVSMRAHPGEGEEGDIITDRPSIPPAVNALDWEVLWGTPVPVAIWESPGKSENAILGVRTRIAPVMQIIFSQRVEGGRISQLNVLYVFVFLLVLAELISFVIGASITRAITGAVHDLYEGTVRVMEGHFSHRIPVKGDDQVTELSRSFNKMTEHVERLLAIAKEKERLQAELEIASEVQAQLYPKTKPELATFSIHACCNPARMVSGDYYDYLLLGPKRVALAVGDVAGKGISAALLMSNVQSSLRTQLRHCLDAAASAGATDGEAPVSTSHLVSQLNQHLYANTSPEKFATLLFSVYDEPSSTLTYTNAGHLPPILIRGEEAQRLEVNGMVVGAFPFAKYDESCIRLEPGDLLVFFTDGISEPENEYGEMYGEERLIEHLQRIAGQGSEEIVKSVMDAVTEWTHDLDSRDDMTILVVRRI